MDYDTASRFSTLIGPSVRVVDRLNCIWVRLFDFKLEVVSKASGSNTVISSTVQDVVVGDTLRLELEGDTLKLILNGTQIGADIDVSGLSSGTNAGFAAEGRTGSALDNFEVGSLSSNAIDIGGISDRQIIHAPGATVNYTISGTYSGNVTPTSIQYRIEEFLGGAIITDWTTLDPSPSAGTYSGSVTIPRGNYYKILVRYGNDNSISAESSRIGFGLIFAFEGQSNIDNMFGAYSPASIDDNVAVNDGTNWSLPTTGEYIEALNKIASDNSCVVGCYSSAVPATSIEDHLSGGSNYANRTASLTAVGGKLSAILWGQGESNLGSSKADYKNKLDTLYTDILTRTGQSSSEVPIFIVQLGRNAGGTGNDAGWSGIREAQEEFAEETTGAYISHQTIDLPMVDSLHRTSGGYVQEMLRFADTYDSVINGNAPSGLGATLISATKLNNDITLSFNLNTATTLINGTNSQNLFELSGDDFATSANPTSVNVSGNSNLTLSFASIPSGTLKLRSCYGQDFTVSEFVTSDLQYNSQNVMVQPIFNGVDIQAIESTLNLSLTGTPDGTQAVRVINTDTEQLLFFGSATFSGGGASLILPILAGANVEYYAIGATEGGLQRGVTV